jgi:hypothetical protein
MIYLDDPFTKEAMTRSLFEPLSAEHERPDEWSGPLGFVIGGMAQPMHQAELDGALAEQYFSAATTLIDSIIDKRVADFEVANAALFLYRHCFELLLKAGLPSKVRKKKNHHRLDQLARSYAYHKKQDGKTVPAWIIRRCEELASIDPDSTAFRYGEYGVPRAADGSEISHEIHVDLHHLKAAMRALNVALVDQNLLVRLARGEAP